jgi:nitrite reductase/ring-hydroxylating ferredoxin subunit
MPDKNEKENAVPAGVTSACGDCPAAAATRRAFIRDVATVVAAALAVGATATPAAALVRAAGAIRPASAGGLLRTYAIPPLDSISVDVANDLILARWQNRLYAFSLKCPHRGTRLEWHADEERIFCPKHKARFTANGAHASGRGSRDLDRYAITRQGSSVVVDLGAVFRADTDAAAWRTAMVAL